MEKRLVDTAKKFATDAIKTASKKVIQKTAKATGDLVGNKIADKITSVSKKSTKKLPTIDEDVELTTYKKRYISPEERQKNIDELRLIKINKLNILCNINIIKMEYQKIVNLLESTSDNPSKFRTRKWVEINDESRGNYVNSDIRFKTTMLRPNLCDYADSYILAKGSITITGEGNYAAAERADERGKGVSFKNCAPFTKCISRINNADINNAHDIDIVIPMYNLIEYSDNYSNTSGSLW